VLPIHNQTPKERLDLKQPQYRKTDRILLFRSKKFGQAQYVDKAMINVGHQGSDQFIRHPQGILPSLDSMGGRAQNFAVLGALGTPPVMPDAVRRRLSIRGFPRHYSGT
jgi:hypothetical protein